MLAHHQHQNTVWSCIMFVGWFIFFKKTQNLHFLKSTLSSFTVYSWNVPLCLFRIKCITQKSNALNFLYTICFCYCSIIIIFPISTIKMIFSFLWSNFILKVILSIKSHTLLWGYLFICSLHYDYFKSPQWTNSWSCLYHTWTTHSLKQKKECFIWNTESLKSQFSWAGCSHHASLCNSECRVILVQCPNFTPLKKSPDSLAGLKGKLSTLSTDRISQQKRLMLEMLMKCSRKMERECEWSDAETRGANCS